MDKFLKDEQEKKRQWFRLFVLLCQSPDVTTEEAVNVGMTELAVHDSRLIAKIREMVLPFLQSYLHTLQTDYQVHPLQATPAVYTSPETQLRNAADAIESKRKEEIELEKLIHALSLLPDNTH